MIKNCSEVLYDLIKRCSVIICKITNKNLEKISKFFFTKIVQNRFKQQFKNQTTMNFSVADHLNKQSFLIKPSLKMNDQQPQDVKLEENEQVNIKKNKDSNHTLKKQKMNGLSVIPSYRELFLNEQQLYSKQNIQSQYNDYVNRFSSKKKMVSYKSIRTTGISNKYYPDVFTYKSMQIPYFSKVEPDLLIDYNKYYSLIQTFNIQKLFFKQIDCQQQMFCQNIQNQIVMKLENSSPKNILDGIQQMMIKYLDLSQIITKQSISLDVGIKVNKKFILYLYGRYRALKFFSQVDAAEELQFEVSKIVYQLIQSQQPNQVANQEKFQQKKNSFSYSVAGSSQTTYEKTEDLFDIQKLNGKRKRSSIQYENEDEEDIQNGYTVSSEQHQVQDLKNQNFDQLQSINKINHKKHKHVELQLSKSSSSDYEIQKEIPSKINNQNCQNNNFIQKQTCQYEKLNSQQNNQNQFSLQCDETNLKNTQNLITTEELSKNILADQQKFKEKEKEKRKQIFHNLSKYLMHLLIELLSEDHLDSFEIIPGYNILIKNLIHRLKQSGKRNKLSQTYYFNHQHYNCIFLTLNSENIQKLVNQKDFIEIHDQVFGKINFYNEEELLNVNIIKVAISKIINIQLDYIIEQIESTLGSQLFEICNINTDCQAKVSYLINVSEGIKKLQKGNQLVRF
ncbi:hypothetical protein TTHERM_00418640 (macronuclear) [Tetrahymena thermophila SB210]|uniref:Uncharacterized protein n=1 Tax=Tetrahymena thermophila (strain SB210) TaxID=312017 RepID=Q22NT7_TETTS|nr:hypothetical protein TTHERM_00418640 [Tetrahymena thermophila SB210]EAR87074.2 hypothetical protein TTHERM_00418640 [Tetrahymena thermophila SB210]|eukprot:XP_001007319.2 hypothetical protein TTHERM_00418640 [Tetrahymena thermophila SB210]